MNEKLFDIEQDLADILEDAEMRLNQEQWMWLCRRFNDVTDKLKVLQVEEPKDVA